MLKINILCAIVALAAAPVVVADELSETGEFLDGVAAIVNEGVVLTSQFNERLMSVKENAARQGIPLPPDDVLNEQILERLILQEIQLQRADRIGLTEQISDQVVNQAIARIANQNGVPFDDMPRLLAEDNIEYASFRSEVRQEIMISELKNIEVMRSIRVSEREIEQFFGLEYESCCWGLRLVSRRHIATRGGTRDSSFGLQLVLKGMTSVGTAADKLLERGILGYSADLR